MTTDPLPFPAALSPEELQILRLCHGEVAAAQARLAVAQIALESVGQALRSAYGLTDADVVEEDGRIRRGAQGE